MPEQLLAVRGAHVRYGAVEALKGVDLDLFEGEAVAVLGANGAGKTTLLRSIMGLTKLSRGEITGPGGSRLDRLKAYRVGARGFALVPEGSGSFTRLTVEENITVGLVARGLSKGDIDERLDDVYGRFPVLQQRRKQKASTLSGGERQMLGLARALAIRPRALLLDEPSLGLAPLVVERVFDEVAKLVASGIGIVLVEQNAHKALEVASRGLVLERGFCRLTGSAAELASNPQVVDAYLGGAALAAGRS